ncbi:hypothetical protein FCV55_22050 [Vibrio sp. F13]|uniref:hypothetical protein n=1 Tax=Vibrio sp. F13 TaxID=2070777 RepID=UPI0010BD405B|nr:hypothetical protein [Vibrio sp. F13]TKF63461.1 hypothetical protein FCV55_22050 [Vibrio sp. F13]
MFKYKVIAALERELIESLLRDGKIIDVLDRHSIKRTSITAYLKMNPKFREIYDTAKMLGITYLGLTFSKEASKRTIRAINRDIKKGIQLVKDSKEEWLIFAMSFQSDIGDTNLEDYKIMIQFEIEDIEHGISTVDIAKREIMIDLDVQTAAL